MSDLGNVVKNLSFFNNENMVSLNQNFEIGFCRGFSIKDIDEIKIKITSLTNKSEQTIKINDGRFVKLNELLLNEETIYLVIELPPYFDISYSDPFLQEKGKFYYCTGNITQR